MLLARADKFRVYQVYVLQEVYTKVKWLILQDIILCTRAHDKQTSSVLELRKDVLRLLMELLVVRSEFLNTLFTSHNSLIAWAKISKNDLLYNLI